MFAAALMPLLLRLAAGPRTRAGRALVIGLGYTLAGAVAVSRVQVGAHSVSEVLAGFALGALASAVALRAGRWPAFPLARWMPAALLIWTLLAVAGAPESRTHSLVTRLALAISGRPQPYQRADMHRDHRRDHPPLKAGTGATSLQRD
jgi:hypothetical protein